MPEPLPPGQRDRVVLRLYEQLLELEQRLIPTGMHVFGHPPGDRQAADMLRMVASFDRPELDARSLPDLVARGLGLASYRELLKESSASEERLKQREQVESIVREAVEILLAGGTAGASAAAAQLAGRASVPAAESLPTLNILVRILGQLSVNQELDSLTRALRGEYIEPGPGADIVQNPDILPTGRNTHAVSPYGIPSTAAFQKSEEVAGALLERCRREQGAYPEAIGMVLWGMDNIKTQGEGVAQALWLMGVEPLRDAMNRVTDVRVLPLERLGRPRIDVVMTISGIFRDLFGTTMELLDKAVRTVAELDEPSEWNFLRKHVREQMAEGCPAGDALIRVFSNAAGNYGTNVNFMVLDSQWEQTEQIGDLFVARKCFAYRRGVEGREARELMERALARVEVTYQNIDNTEVGITDVDHYFEYLGGLSRAVAKRSGAQPKAYLSDSLSPLAKIRSLEETVRLEARTKVLNPKWYEGMLRHGFSGVAEIEHHVSNTFGWSATADAVDGWIYDEIASTYVLDQAMLDRLRSLNPHATRSLALRLLEAEGRGFWASDQAVVDRLHDVVADVENQLEGVRQ
ncbi:MAG TPA: cobaltochelatase subunit CobN [Bryobacteraceae bacterium]|nr:cobaltochelatase subunit CobN [Bryobacteraceae bacterium]